MATKLTTCFLCGNLSHLSCNHSNAVRFSLPSHRFLTASCRMRQRNLRPNSTSGPLSSFKLNVDDVDLDGSDGFSCHSPVRSSDLYTCKRKRLEAEGGAIAKFPQTSCNDAFSVSALHKKRRALLLLSKALHLGFKCLGRGFQCRRANSCIAGTMATSVKIYSLWVFANLQPKRFT